MVILYEYGWFFPIFIPLGSIPNTHRLVTFMLEKLVKI